MFFLVKRRAAVEDQIMLIVNFLGKNNCTRKQHTLKAVINVWRNIELYSCQTIHIKPKNSYRISKSSKTSFAIQLLPPEIKFRLNHLNTTCSLNMKTRLRYRQTPSHQSLVHCVTQKSLRLYSLYFAVRSLHSLTAIKRQWEALCNTSVN